MNTKICKWCGKEYHRPATISNPNWEKSKCCSFSCGTSYMWHRCSKEEHEANVVKKYCLYCDKELVRREKEPYSNWSKRVLCNKACAGYLKKGRSQNHKPRLLSTQTKKDVTPEQAAGVTILKPGDSRFEELRRLYEGK